ncbi:MAG: hypothetical protein WC112_08750 [Proteiniphilum sp.]|jgi:hypothetical protein
MTEHCFSGTNPLSNAFQLINDESEIPRYGNGAYRSMIDVAGESRTDTTRVQQAAYAASPYDIILTFTGVST